MTRFRSGFAIALEEQTDVREETHPLTAETLAWLSERVTADPVDWELRAGLLGWGPATHTLIYRGADLHAGAYHVEVSER